MCTCGEDGGDERRCWRSETRTRLSILYVICRCGDGSVGMGTESRDGQSLEKKQGGKQRIKGSRVLDLLFGSRKRTDRGRWGREMTRVRKMQKMSVHYSGAQHGGKGSIGLIALVTRQPTGGV